jgi:uncharacterized protein (TIGR00725 family)
MPSISPRRPAGSWRSGGSHCAAAAAAASWRRPAGAPAAGGHTIGILPGHDTSESPPNPWVEFPVFTGIGYARNSAVVLSGDAVIAIDGAYGTLSEIAFALIHNVPLVGLDTWDFAYRGHDHDKIVRAANPQEAVEKAVEMAKQHRSDSGPAR